MERMSWAKTLPSWSAAMRPMKALVPPSDATPAQLLATEPPDCSVPGPMAL